MIVRAFGVEERPFLLKVAQWRDLEKVLNCGLGMAAARLADVVALKAGSDKGVSIMALIRAGRLGDGRLDDVRETLVQGLIGGGLSSTEAGVLVRNVFDESAALGRGPMFDWADLALEIILCALIGLPDEKPGEPKAAARKAPRVRRSKTARPASSTSMAP